MSKPEKEPLDLLADVEAALDRTFTWTRRESPEAGWVELSAIEGEWSFTILAHPTSRAFDGAAMGESVLIRLSSPALRQRVADVLTRVLGGNWVP